MNNMTAAPADEIKCNICDKTFAKASGREVHISLSHFAKGITTKEQYEAKKATK